MIRPASLFKLALLTVLCSLAVHAETPQGYLDSLVGQKMLLRHFGDTEQVRVKNKDLAGLAGTCDVAVIVKEATWEKKKVKLIWEQIGTPSGPGIHPHVCRDTMVYSHGVVEIEDFKPDESAESLAASLRTVLQTPEQYLAAENVIFNLPEEADLPAPPEMDPRPQPVPRPLLTVDPNYTSGASRARLNGTVIIALYVGTDGRVHQPRVTQKLGMGLDEKALNVLSMWRFEPGRRQEQPVACSMSIQISFNVY